ncbi:Gurmarin/antimicrobial peptide [Metarhizium album ARSEF 1941]|uniref:Gurmarin/antimicrobial peptide n=1 Tax=Metarhizium album (strain ARSEF 1941) TaxID=1081103 RepID=A0A0B2WUG3_METAS|nr:Gurmarin/antimicrobial peptide [Metarhizium album ARSEF 1941]KHN96585.1 Gurmarin/antimicrobial peptide [Metarhizium album ARSEF 1941]
MKFVVAFTALFAGLAAAQLDLNRREDQKCIADNQECTIKDLCCSKFCLVQEGQEKGVCK